MSEMYLRWNFRASAPAGDNSQTATDYNPLRAASPNIKSQYLRYLKTSIKQISICNYGAIGFWQDWESWPHASKEHA